MNGTPTAWELMAMIMGMSGYVDTPCDYKMVGLYSFAPFHHLYHQKQSLRHSRMTDGCLSG